MILKNSTFNVLKWIALIALPATATFWYAIGTTWNLPYVQEIQVTITAIDTLLGTLLGVASNQYNKKANDFSGIPEREDNV